MLSAFYHRHRRQHNAYLLVLLCVSALLWTVNGARINSRLGVDVRSTLHIQSRSTAGDAASASSTTQGDYVPSVLIPAYPQGNEYNDYAPAGSVHSNVNPSNAFTLKTLDPPMGRQGVFYGHLQRAPYGQSTFAPESGYHGVFPQLGGPTSLDYSYFPSDSFSSLLQLRERIGAAAASSTGRGRRRRSAEPVASTWSDADAVEEQPPIPVAADLVDIAQAGSASRSAHAAHRFSQQQSEGRVLMASLDELPRIEAQESMRLYLHQMRLAQQASGQPVAQASQSLSQSMQSQSASAAASTDPGVTLPNAGLSGRAAAEGFIPVYDPKSMNYPTRRGLQMPVGQAMEAEMENEAGQRTALFMPRDSRADVGLNPAYTTGSSIYQPMIPPP